MLNKEQQEACNKIEKWFKNPKDKPIFTLAGYAGTGKAQPIDTVIPTPNGFKQLSQLSIGDFVFDRNGYPTKVSGIFPQGYIDSYRVYFEDGRVTECNDEHLWTVYTSKDKFITKTLRELMSSGLRYESSKGAYKYKVPICNPVDYPVRDFAISPYDAGVILAKGEAINDLETSSQDRSIPEIYKISSIRQRYELLQGLFDMRGSITYNDGRYSLRFNTNNYDLCVGIIEIVESLGYFSPTIMRDEREKYSNSVYYNLIINIPNEDKKYFFRKSKMRDLAVEAENKNKRKKYDRIAITKVVKCAPKEMLCIMVDNEEHLYLTNNYIVTHNTFLINHLVNIVLNLPKEKIAYVAPTAKAASVLIQKGLPASTIHRTFYINDDDKIVNGRKVPHFIKKKEISDYELVIIDEVSMVSKKILEDILSFEIPVLACGDPGQLPPVMAEDNHLLDHPDATLTEIVRQAEDSPIIQVATMARNKEFIPYGKYGDNVFVVKRSSIKDETFNKLVMQADQIICGTNNTRRSINEYVRKLYNKTSIYPEVGDKVICCQNNYDFTLGENAEYPLANGIIGKVESIKPVNVDEGLSQMVFKPDFLDFKTEPLIIDNGIFISDDFFYDRHQKIYELEDKSYTIVRQLSKKKDEDEEVYRSRLAIELKNRTKSKDEFQICQFDFGYAISCHKSQGSEWDNIIVFDESKVFPTNREKWLYTAITRAKKNLIIIRN